MRHSGGYTAVIANQSHDALTDEQPRQRAARDDLASRQTPQISLTTGEICNKRVSDVLPQRCCERHGSGRLGFGVEGATPPSFTSDGSLRISMARGAARLRADRAHHADKADQPQRSCSAARRGCFLEKQPQGIGRIRPAHLINSLGERQRMSSQHFYVLRTGIRFFQRADATVKSGQIELKLI
jgi:hypothetical protein